MQTNDLIRSLVADLDTPAPRVAPRLAASVLLGLAASGAGFAVALGPRPDIAAALMTARFEFKILMLAGMSSLAAALVVRMARPTASARTAVYGLLAVGLAFWLAAAVEASVIPRAQWWSAAKGSNAYICLPAIVIMSLPVLAAAVWALRRGAPAHPGACGALAGLLAGALAASMYATHCTDDSPLFVAVWYGLAFAAVTLLGWLAGRIWLRW